MVYSLISDDDLLRVEVGIMNNLEMLIAEYQFGEEVGGKYFSYMYSILNFTLVFYGAILAIFRDLFVDPQSSVLFVLVITYLLPVVTYILGLFYAYNAVAISRQGYFMIRIESDIIRLNKQFGFKYPLHGWDIFAKNYPSGFLLPYGTMLMFYIIMPIAMFAFSIIIIDVETLFSLFNFYLFICIIPAILLLVYLIFMTYLIFCMFVLKRIYTEALTECDLDDVILEGTFSTCGTHGQKEKR